MRLKVCPRCGSKNIFAGKMSSGILFGVSSWMEECRDCGFKGSPVVFDSEKEYLTFLKQIRSEENEEIEMNTNDIDEISEDISQNIDEVDEDTGHWHSGGWWIELVVGFLIAVLISFLGIFRNISIFGLGVGIVYTLLEFIIYLIFVIIGIIIIEYILYLIRKK